MATTTTTVAAVDPDHPPHLRLDSIPIVDLHLLSQSELHSLSKCSNSSFDLSRCDDVVIPKIDRSVFNESAGSRKQTYSRLRLAPAVTSSSSPTIHRRTPHLRPSITPVLNNANDYEKVENSQIIQALKQLFKSNPSFDDYTAVEVEIDGKDGVLESLKPTEAENNGNGENVVVSESSNPVEVVPESSNPVEVVPESSNPVEVVPEPSNPVEVVPESLNPVEAVPESLNPVEVVPESLNTVEVNTEGNIELDSEMKRKRGRPRKHEESVLITPPIRKRMRKMHNDTVMKLVVYDREMDKELVNCRGVKVDLVKLGKLEDPYGPEIMKRTEGLSTSDEMLGFLRGLKGEWGTTRKKRRVVDASDFGDALPKGWRLILLIRIKGGRVWVHCHRYISPSGRSFETCKDVSTYLLSLVGEENLDKPACTLDNDHVESASKGVLMNATDVNVHEDPKTDMTVPDSPSPIDAEKDETIIVHEPENIVPELSNSEMRRKRGRPRKHENAVPVSRKKMCNDTVKKVVEYDTFMDRDIVNCKGVEIDLVNLGKLEDPFGPEIRKRTEGMLTADELLGFLRGLNGEWGTTRKKRRVVDASEFGDVLPKGWRLSLCIKKKDGHVWVFCRRYISPSGRQFESCKDVSMYLLSVVGDENLGKPTNTHTNDCDDSVSKGASENDTDLFVQEELETNDPILESLSPIEGEKDRNTHVSESLKPIEVENVTVTNFCAKISTMLATGRFTPARDRESLAQETELSVSETRRKRGRPRKDENAVSVSPVLTKKIHNDNDTVNKKVVVYDTDKDREIVNCRGVKVNLENLASLDDPYGPEIRMRTEGMLTADELLGFLRGLNGEWGTTRKKRRVVDASEFGDFLPIGWRLSLCIKKKVGCVWLFCRRYISPSGRQFETCKDISGYLLSIVRQENFDKPSSTRTTHSDNSALKNASLNAGDIYVKQITPIHSSPALLPISSPPPGFENQKVTSAKIADPVNQKVTSSKIVDPVVVQEVYKCLKCFIIFEGKINLSDHQALAHKHEEGSAIPNFSIVIGGIFECNFCHKTFYEINQYNQHIGTHVANETKTPEAQPETFYEINQYNGHIGTHVANETKSPESSSPEKTFDDTVSISPELNDDAADTHDPLFSSPSDDNKIVSGTESKLDEVVVHDLNMDGDVLPEEESDDDGDIGNNFDIEDENVSSDDVFVLNSDDKVENNTDSVVKPGFCLGREASVSINNEFNDVDAKSECMPGVQTTNICEKKIFQEDINDTHVCSSFDNLASEKEKAVLNTESSSGAFHGRIVLDEAESEQLSLFSPNKDTFKTINESIIPSKNQESPKKFGFDATVVDRVTPLGFDATVDRVTPRGFDENRISYGVASYKHDNNPYKVSSSTHEYYKESKPASNEKFHNHNNGINESLHKPGGVNLDSFHNYKNIGSMNSKVASFGSSQDGINAGVTRFNTEKQVNFSSSPAPARNQQQEFDFQDDVTGLYGGPHGSSQKGLLDHFCVAETSDDIFGNKLYSTPLDGLKFDEEGIHELSLTFGNPQKDVPPKIDNPFDVQTDLSMVNNSMVRDLNRGSESVGRSSFSSSRNSESRALQQQQHNSNTGYSGRTWEGPALDQFRSSDQNKFMIGSGSTQSSDQNKLMIGSGSRQSSDQNKFMFGSGNSQSSDQNKFMIGSGSTQSSDQSKLMIGSGSSESQSSDQNKFMIGSGSSQHRRHIDAGLQQQRHIDAGLQQQRHIEAGLQHRHIEPGLQRHSEVGVQHHRQIESGLQHHRQIERQIESGLQHHRHSEAVLQHRHHSESGLQHRRSEDGPGPLDMWKSAERNQLQSGFVHPPPVQTQQRQTQSPSFHSFDIMSAKAEDGVFRVDERYNGGGMSVGRSEPVEFRFLAGRSEHNNPHAALQGGSRGFPYNNNNNRMEQAAFDTTNFWMGNNGMMHHPNMGGGRNNVVTTIVCAWCRNQFQMPPAMAMHPESQAGSLCPTCTAGFSGQVNML
ncbi:uncharacterized protein [Rutidosis leptorrhynchoides]|uniref:uncharacterized protein n=1 Tax=Rutidosis leptorrhynchoides TaxID=125765 RepID=UPI003A98FB44